MATNGHSKLEIISGYLAVIGSLICCAFSSAAVQALQGVVHDFELSAARGLLQGPLYIVVGTLIGVDLKIKREHVPLLIYLGFLFVFYNIGYYGSTVFLPLVDCIGLVTIFAMIAALVQSKLLFKKDIHVLYIISLVVCASGIVLVIQPHYLFPGSIDLEKNVVVSNLTENQSLNVNTKVNIATSKLSYSGAQQIIGYVLCIVGGTTVGMAYDVNSVLLQDVRPFVKTTYFTLVYFIASVLIAIYAEPIVLVMSLEQYLMVFAHAASSAISTFCNIYSAHMIGGVRVSLIYSLQIIVNLMVQYTFMKSYLPGHQNWIEVTGAVIVVLGVAISPILDIIRSVKGSDELP